MTSKFNSFLSKVREVRDRDKDKDKEKEKAKEEKQKDEERSERKETKASWASMRSRLGGAAARANNFIKTRLKKEEEGPTDPSMAPQTKEEREREERILKILEEFKLQGGAYHTDMVMAKSGDRLLGGIDDEEVLHLVWYRMTTNGLLELPGVEGGFYQPSVDDVGVRVLCRCQDSEREEFTGFGEVGPLVMDPKVQATADEHVSNCGAEFVVGLSAGGDLSWKLVVTEDNVVLEGEAAPVADADAAGAGEDSGEEEDAKPLATPFNVEAKGVKIKLDPADTQAFRVLVPPKLLRDAPDADTPADDAASTGTSTAAQIAAAAAATAAALIPEAPIAFHLRASSNVERDVIALVVRHFCFDDSPDYEEEPEPVSPGPPSLSAAALAEAAEEVAASSTPRAADAPPSEAEEDVAAAIEADIAGEVFGGADAVAGGDAEDTAPTPPQPPAEANGDGDTDADAAASPPPASETPPPEAPGDAEPSVGDAANPPPEPTADAPDAAAPPAADGAAPIDLRALRAELDAGRQATTLERTKYKTAIRKLTALKTEHAAQTTELASVRREAQKAARMLADAAKALAAEEEQSVTLRLEKGTAMERLAETQTELQGVRAELVGKVSALATLQSQYDKLQIRMQKTQREEKTVAKSLDEVTAETSGLRAKLAELQAQLEGAEKSHQVANESVLSMTTERDDLKEAVSTLRRRIRELEASQSRVAAELEESTADLETNRGLVATYKEQQSVDKEQLAALRKANREAEAKCKAAEDELAALSGSTESDKARLVELEGAAEEAATLKEQLTAALADVDTLTAERNSASRSADSLKQDMRKLQKQLKAAQSRPAAAPAPAAAASSPRGAFTGARASSPHARAPPPPPRQRHVGSSSSSPLTMSPPPRVHVGVPGGGSGSSMEMQLQRLANELADQLHDKEVALAQQRSTKELLAARITELERQVAKLEGRDV